MLVKHADTTTEDTPRPPVEVVPEHEMCKNYCCHNNYAWPIEHVHFTLQSFCRFNFALLYSINNYRLTIN